MKSINPITKLAKSLAKYSAALLPSHLPVKPCDLFRHASDNFTETLYNLFNKFDVESHGYCYYDNHWYATVEAPHLFSNCSLSDGSDFAPYYIKGLVRAYGATPQECIESLINKWNEAEDWQRKMIRLANAANSEK